jgi:hypothetical protein
LWPARTPSGYRDSPVKMSIASCSRWQPNASASPSPRSPRSRRSESAENGRAYVLGVLDRQVDDLGQFIGDLEAFRTELIAPEGRADRLPKDHTRYCSVIGHATPSE